ncbi:MAG: hypothetical protein H6Q92_1889, partial [Nitrospirae bacterium]|nr:hypothetical protein [Nitrospirota bacterium]
SCENDQAIALMKAIVEEYCGDMILLQH